MEVRPGKGLKDVAPLWDGLISSQQQWPCFNDHGPWHYLALLTLVGIIYETFFIFNRGMSVAVLTIFNL